MVCSVSGGDMLVCITVNYMGEEKSSIPKKSFSMILLKDEGNG